MTSLEIIVVDNAGDLGDGDIRPAIGDVRLKLLNPGANLYCSGGRRFGAERATGELLFFIDDDNILDRSCIRELIESFVAIPGLGMAGPLMLIYKKKDQIWAAGAHVNKWGITIHLHMNDDRNRIQLPKVIEGVDYFPNAFMVRTDLLKEVPFDVATFPHNWSEPDFGLRLKQKGYKIAAITTAIDWHDIDYFGHTTRTDYRKIYDQAKSRILFRRRFFNGFNDKLRFWVVIFPASSLYYFKAALKSQDDRKIRMMLQYVRGTFDGTRDSIVEVR